MKKFLKLCGTGLLVIGMFAVLCGCMTEEDKALAKENVRTGRGLVKAYVAENYGEYAKIQEIECINQAKDGGPIPDFYDHPSNYVRASVEVKQERFQVLVNVETGAEYDNRYEDSVNESMQRYAVSRGGIPKPEAVLLKYFPIEITEIPDSACFGFAQPNTKLFEQLLYQGKSNIRVLFQYVDEYLRPLEAEGEKLIPMDREIGRLQIGFVSFRTSLPGDLSWRQMDELMNEVNESVSETCIIDRWKSYDSETDTYVYPEELDVTYHHYDLLALDGGISLVYDTETLDVDVKEEKAPETTVALDKRFVTWDGKQYQITGRQKQEQTEFDIENQSIHLFFPDKYEDLFLVSEQDGDEDWNQLYSGWDGTMTEWFAVHGGQSEITFGLYTEMD
ncbi:MAG: hypothetical protein HP058_01920 [Massilimaliae sp.]|nr:hypothetical protein [Massiliimalia sp.]